MSFGTLQIEKMTTESGYSLGAGNASSFKNRIINGGMVISQSAAGAAVTTHNAFPVDRFNVTYQADGAFSAQQNTSAPAGFINSLKYTITTADSSLGTDQYLFVRQNIEGLNCSDLAWGSANAKTVTLSFWVRSSVTGTYCVNLRNSAADRQYIAEYTISVADTWEQKTITVTGDTTGTWLTTNGIGIQIRWTLGAGTNYQGSTGWSASSYFATSSQTNLAATLNATWYVTGVQLEVGTVATSFDFRSYGTELALCQRYYQLAQTGSGPMSSTSINGVYMSIPFNVAMRTTPTATVVGTVIFENMFGANPSISSIAAVRGSTFSGADVSLILTGASGTGVVGAAMVMNVANTAYGLGFSAEL